MNYPRCPICKKQFVKQGLRNHIINKAKGEAYQALKNLLFYNKRGRIEFSSIVLLRNYPHLNYVKKNLKLSNKQFLEL
jgi:hypothetical protein